MKPSFFAAAFLLVPALAFAQPDPNTGIKLEKPEAQPRRVVPMNEMVPDDGDGVLEAYEYEVLDKAKGLTGRPCPYMCKNRDDLPRERCKEWFRPDKQYCYVQATGAAG